MPFSRAAWGHFKLFYPGFPIFTSLTMALSKVLSASSFSQLRPVSTLSSASQKYLVWHLKRLKTQMSTVKWKRNYAFTTAQCSSKWKLQLKVAPFSKSFRVYKTRSLRQVSRRLQSSLPSLFPQSWRIILTLLRTWAMRLKPTMRFRCYGIRHSKVCNTWPKWAASRTMNSSRFVWTFGTSFQRMSWKSKESVRRPSCLPIIRSLALTYLQCSSSLTKLHHWCMPTFTPKSWLK